jgi:CDP-glucose 4,6-dehydratase
MLTVGDVADLVVKHWGEGRWEHRPSASDMEPGGRMHEAAFLTLDISKAGTLLGWRPVFSPKEAVAETVRWYRRRQSEGERFDARAACREQIAHYEQRRRS